MKFNHYISKYHPLFLGAIVPLGFAPFHYFSILYLALLFFFLSLEKNPSHRFQSGYWFGVGFHLIGTSWVYVSIHEYGHLHPVIAGLITMLFILFLAGFYGVMTFIYHHLKSYCPEVFKPLVFASSWCAAEFLRAHCLGGFPWLILGFSALNSPFDHLLPHLGVYGPSFVMCMALGYLALGITSNGLKRLYGIVGLLGFMLPHYLNVPQAPHEARQSISVSIIQGNVKMQDKWDEQLFWSQYFQYLAKIKQLLAPQRLIILPEAAITAPSSYMHDELKYINQLAKKQQSAIVLGIPQSAGDEYNYHNSILALGEAKGSYFKQQLVPFGEYIPQFWIPIIRFLQFPIVNTIPGDAHQPLITVFGHPIASLICYELAYPERLRPQLPKGQMVISLSDDGWFGHSLALYQHLQMAQTLSRMAHREQIFSNNNGLSSLINTQGQIVKQLPSWKAVEARVDIHTSQLMTPWMTWGDKPVLLFCFCILSFAFLYHSFKIRQLSNTIELPVNT
jgi:apolipoprotein N-acyltransferase